MRKFISGIFLPALLLLSQTLVCGNIHSLKKDYSLRVWTSDNGLPVNSIRAIAQTSDGFIWLGTEEGLVRFDGISFFTFDPSNNPNFADKDVQSLYIFSDSSMVAGFYHGDLVSYKKLQFIRLFNRELNWIKSIQCLSEDPGKGLWFGTYGLGLGHLGYDGKMTFTTDKNGLPNDFVQAILKDKDSSLWIGTRFGLCHLKNGVLKVYSTRDGLSYNDIRSLCFDREGRLWIGTNGGGISIFSEGKFSRFSAFGKAFSQNILSLFRESGGGIWIGTNSGLYLVKEGRVSGITSSEGLSGNIISSIYEDREHTIWAGTEGTGLNALRPRVISMFTEDEGLSDHSTGPVIKGPGGSVYVGTGKGAVNAISSAGIQRFEKIGLPPLPVNTLAFDSSGMLWIGTDGAGIFGYGKDKTVHLTTADGLAADVILALYSDHSGKLWAGTANAGVNIMNRGRIEWFGTSRGMSNDQVLCFLEDSKGRMLVGTNGGGINIFEKGKIRWLTSETGLPDNVINSMYEDHDGLIWVGCSHGGLVMLENDSASIFNTDDGLYSDGIQQICEDNRGRLWMSSNKGIFSLSRNELIAYHDNKGDFLRPMVFGKPEGMLTAECSSRVFPAGCITANNRLWIPTPRGLAMLDLDHAAPYSVSLALLLTKVLINNQEVNPLAPQVLSPGTVDIEFDYTSPTFLNPEKTQYKYMLTGFDHFWVNAGNRRQAYYTHLPPGSYVFKVMAQGHNGQWTREKNLFVFRIRPFFYKTSWFILPVVAVMILIFWLFISFRIRKSRENMLTHLVNDRTKDLEEEVERRKEAQEESNIARIRIEESDRLKSSLISFINQKFRSPVNSIMGFSELMMEKDQSATKEEMPRYIHESGEEMIKVLDSVMLVARIEQGEGSQEKIMDVLPLVERSLHSEPLAGPGEETPAGKSTPRTPRSGTGRHSILLVEDNRINAELVKTYLSGRYDLDIAPDAATAIRMAADSLYDAILMDINLGPGMDGIEATQEIRKLEGYAGIPVIAVTGFTMAGMKEKIMNGGASYFLAKPFGRNMLVDLLVTALPGESQNEDRDEKRNENRDEERKENREEK
ncbi:MAG: two-component regulator propeller domain-containing protein [Bacteroidota bacterium]|jgi:ligand-binding sensor domain-containing protein/CheY-like chemotaxis protein